MSAQVRICVIGAGAAGICAARHLSKLYPHNDASTIVKFLPVIFEKSDKIGGTWVYNSSKENERVLQFEQEGIRSNHEQDPNLTTVLHSG